MDCSRVRESLGRFVDGELAPAAASAVGSHVTSCPACASQIESLRRLGDLLRSLPDANPPDGLESSILEAARFRTRRVPRPSSLSILARVAAAATIALSGLYLGARLSEVHDPQAAVAAATRAADPLAPDSGPFQLVPPDSPGALCLALLSEESR